MALIAEIFCLWKRHRRDMGLGLAVGQGVVVVDAGSRAGRKIRAPGVECLGGRGLAV